MNKLEKTGKELGLKAAIRETDEQIKETGCELASGLKGDDYKAALAHLVKLKKHRASLVKKLDKFTEVKG